MAGAGTPLRLKDLLELDCDSCSAAGFRCYPRRLGSESPSLMRHLLGSSSSEAARRFGRSPSLRRPGKLSHLSRSLSRRLRGGFWRRGSDEEAAAAVSSACACGSEPETSSESSDNSSVRRRGRSQSSSDSDFSSASSASVSMHAAVLLAAGDEHEAMKRGSSSGSEVDDDKEQLSPVAVMDFPFDDCGEDEEGDGGDAEEGRDDAGPCSPSLDDSLAGLQRRKMQKIRRLGNLDEQVPVDLEALLVAASDPDEDEALDGDVPAQQQLQRRTDAATPPHASSGHSGADAHGEPDEHGLLVTLLMDTVSASVDDVSERLLLDFFVEMKRRRSGAPAGPLPRKIERLGDGEVLAAPRGWLDSAETGRWGLKDVLGGGEAVVAEMERGRRWMHVGEETLEVGAVVAGMLVDRLVDEVVRDLRV